MRTGKRLFAFSRYRSTWRDLGYLDTGNGGLMKAVRNSRPAKPRVSSHRHRGSLHIFPSTVLTLKGIKEGTLKCRQATGRAFISGTSLPHNRPWVCLHRDLSCWESPCEETWSTTPTCGNQCATIDSCYKALREY